MFVIKERHVKALEQAARECFEDRVCDYLSCTYPETCQRLGRAAVLDRVREGIDRAAGHDIHHERDVTAFIRLMFAIDPRFDSSWQTRWARRILDNRTFGASRRLAAIRVEARRRGYPKGRVA